MYSGEVGRPEEFALCSRRNYSISPAGQVLVFGSLALVTLAISVGFALQGAWPVLPFAGLECGALFLAFRWLQRHAQDYELITIEGDLLVVESSVGGKIESSTFSRTWVQLNVESSPAGRHKMFLRSHGREVEVGKLLSDEAKRSAAKRIRDRIAAVYTDSKITSGEV